MEFKAKCPKCETTTNKIHVDTSGAQHGDIYRDVVECTCGEAFILETTITAETKVLAVAEQAKTGTRWSEKNSIKRALADLQKAIAAL